MPSENGDMWFEIKDLARAGREHTEDFFCRALGNAYQFGLICYEDAVRYISDIQDQRKLAYLERKHGNGNYRKGPRKKRPNNTSMDHLRSLGEFEEGSRLCFQVRKGSSTTYYRFRALDSYRGNGSLREVPLESPDYWSGEEVETVGSVFDEIESNLDKIEVTE